MAYLGKDEDGDYILDPDEVPPTPVELAWARDWFNEWVMVPTPRGRAVPACPHSDTPYPCEIPGARECLGKIVWWRRYICEIETDGSTVA
jgi:hypothetical protein